MCTVKKQGNLYIVTLINNDEHRLNPNLINSIRSSLAQVRSDYAESGSPPSALITTGRGRFYSNGYDLAWARSTTTTGSPEQSKFRMDALLRSLVRELVELPMPTIAAVNGHAAAAGMVLAMSHDYVAMRREKGFLYMSELDIGLVVPEWFMAVVRCRIGGWRGRRRVVLAAEKVTAEVGREIGVADVVAEKEVEAVAAIGEELVGRGWDSWVYGEIRKGLFKEILDLIGDGDGDGGVVEDGEDDDEGVKVRSRL